MNCPNCNKSDIPSCPCIKSFKWLNNPEPKILNNKESEIKSSNKPSNFKETLIQKIQKKIKKVAQNRVKILLYANSIIKTVQRVSKKFSNKLDALQKILLFTKQGF